ncbi:MAG: type II toxin-antitoxin system Phd/YefM family antitoxin [Phycisphaeraceae bacterium]|nr:type II toxin-antitoxin system Phd/YefM family antitoxin [Phycisphaeraceae bacterium]
MLSVGSFEAKTHLPQLLERVERGESITITRHGKPVARLVPVTNGEARITVPDLLDKFRELRAGVSKDGPSIRQLIDEGRRY